MAVERECWSAGDLEIDVGRQRVERAGQEIPLPPLSFRLLLELVRAAPNVLSIDELMDRVWVGLLVSTDTVTQRIKLLRKALGDTAQGSRYIRGLRGRGYSCIVPVTRCAAERGAGVRPVPLPESAAPHRPRETVARPPVTGPERRRLLIPLASALAIALLLVATWSMLPVRDPVDGAEADTIAVLPFADVDGTADDAYLADAIAEDLIGRLAQAPELRVIASTSSRTFRDRAISIAGIRDQLDVAYVLQGSFRREGSQLRVRAELVRTADSAVVWAQSFVRPPAELFDVRDEIGESVFEQLHVSGIPEATRPVISNEAHTLFLRANYLTQRSSPEGFTEALALYRQSLELAPGYAAAWEGVARIHQFQGSLGLRPRHEAYALARQAATKALAIDPEFAVAHARLGVIALREGDLATAARHIEHGYVLDPRNQLTVGNAVHLMRSIGRMDAALALNRVADAIDPLNPRGNLSSGITKLIAGNYEDAIGKFEATLQLSPGFVAASYYLGIALLLKGEPEAARAAVQREPSEPYRLRGEAIVATAMGQSDVADTALQALIALHAQGRSSAYGIACVYAYRGMKADAFTWLDRAFGPGEGDPEDWQVLVEPLLRGLHDDPRWSRLMARLGRSPAELESIRFEVPSDR